MTQTFIGRLTLRACRAIRSFIVLWWGYHDWQTAIDGLTLTAMAYSNAWNSTDQLAQRAIDQGIIGRFGTLDPTDGGVSSRFSLSGNFTHSSEYGQSKITTYVARSDLQLYNNFNYALDNPVNGDQFNQLDSRTLGGFDASHAFDWRVGGLET